MGISDSDFFLVDDNGVSKKVRADKLKADRNNGTNLYSNKKLLINSADHSESHFIYFSDLEDKAPIIDWMLVNSNGQSYKVSGTQIADYFGIVFATGEDITSQFYEISSRFLASPSTSDYTGGYDVREVATNFSGVGRIYLGVKVTASTTYYNDIPIAGVQVVRGGVLVASWIFNTSSGGSGGGWKTITYSISGSSSYGIGRTPSSVATLSYSTITTSTNVHRFTWATATSSRYTGAADGISSDYKMPSDGGSGTIASTGNTMVSQTSGTYYAYRETSGSARYSTSVMRSPEFTFMRGDVIKVIHLLTGYYGTPQNSDDSLYIAVI